MGLPENGQFGALDLALGPQSIQEPLKIDLIFQLFIVDDMVKTVTSNDDNENSNIDKD